MRARPAVGREVALEVGLPPREIGGILEVLDAFGAVGVDDAQFVAAARQVGDFVPQELAAPLEPPEHSNRLSARDRKIFTFSQMCRGASFSHAFAGLKKLL